MASSGRGSSRPGRRGPPRGRGGPRRPPADDPPREATLELLAAVRERDAYANLMLPALLREHRVTGRDASLATELSYGTCRSIGLLDAVLARCSQRPLSEVDGLVLDALRLGAYQLLRTRVPSHAAVAATVNVTRGAGGSAVAGFVNAVLRRVSERDEAEWIQQVAPPLADDPIGHLAMAYTHPRWIAVAVAEALGLTDPSGGSPEHDELAAALRANNERPLVHLTARPGEISADELAAMTGGELGRYSPYAVRLVDGGDPADIPAVVERLAQVQDEASQLVTLALARAPVAGSDTRWVDLCAGPGGKTSLLGAFAAIDGATVDAVEPAEHRANLVRQACADQPVTVHVRDGRDSGLAAASFDRVLLDVPCTGLGALRRRPEARWRRDPSDVEQLASLQRQLLAAGIRLTRPGGVVAYVTCSPHRAETVEVANSAVEAADVTSLDAREYLPGLEALGAGPYLQLWPHRHDTDGLFCALFRRA